MAGEEVESTIIISNILEKYKTQENEVPENNLTLQTFTPIIMYTGFKTFKDS